MDHPEIVYITYITASLGIIGSLFIIFTYVAFKEARTFGTLLVFFLSIADLLHGLEWYPWGITKELCIAQGMIMQWSELSYYFWTLCIASCIFQIHYLERDEVDVSSLMPLYQLCCWFLPLVLSAIPLLEGNYGRGAYNWCWLSSSESSESLDKAFLYVPAGGVFLFNTTAFILVHKRLSKYRSEYTQSLKTNMTLYVLAFVLAQGPAVINRIQTTIQPDKEIYALYLLQAIFHPLQGFFDSVAYGINEPAFTTNYKLLFIRWGLLSNRTFTNAEQINYGSFSPSIPRGEYDYDYDSPYTSRKRYTSASIKDLTAT